MLKQDIECSSKKNYLCYGLFKRSLDPMVLIDKSYNILDVNNAFTVRFGTICNNDIGKNVAEFIELDIKELSKETEIYATINASILKNQKKIPAQCLIYSVTDHIGKNKYLLSFRERPQAQHRFSPFIMLLFFVIFTLSILLLI